MSKVVKIDDYLKPLVDRIRVLENEVAVLEFHRNVLYEQVESLVRDTMERDKKTWVAGSCGGVD